MIDATIVAAGACLSRQVSVLLARVGAMSYNDGALCCGWSDLTPTPLLRGEGLFSALRALGLGAAGDDTRESCGQALFNVVIGQAQDGETFSAQDRIAFLVIGLGVVVSGAIQFNYQLALEADKIHDESSYRLLSPNTQPRQTPTAYRVPQNALSVRHFTPKLARPLCFGDTRPSP